MTVLMYFAQAGDGRNDSPAHAVIDTDEAVATLCAPDRHIVDLQLPLDAKCR